MQPLTKRLIETYGLLIFGAGFLLTAFPNDAANLYFQIQGVFDPDEVALFSSRYSSISRMLGVTFLIFGFILLRYTVENPLFYMRGVAGVANTEVNQGRASEETAEEGGFVFFEMDEEKKLFFQSVMSGFEDYASLKGYDISFSIDTSKESRVGIRFTINDVGVTVGSKAVRKDIEEYLEKVRNRDDFSDMPMVESPEDHRRLVAAINARVTLLEHQAELKGARQEAESYKEMFHALANMQNRGIHHRDQPEIQNILQLTHDQRGATAMGDKYEMVNSPGSAQGKDVTNEIHNANFNLNDPGQVSDVLSEIDEVIELLSASEIEDKERYLSHLNMVKEEIERAGEKDKGLINSLLGSFSKVLNYVESGSKLFRRIKGLLAAFGA